MNKVLLFLNTTVILLIPILVMILYSIFAMGVSTNVPETCEINEEACKVEAEAPENQVEIEFLERNYQSVVDQKDGNIPMVIFEQRVEFAVSYRPIIAKYLETDSYRYQLTTEAKGKVGELVDENSYANTVNNIHEWVNDNIEYSSDRNWYTAQSTWEKKKANCNGISFLACGMMREAGVPCVVVASKYHAWTEYLYVDDQGRLVWSVWDQGVEGYPALSSNVYEYDLN